MPCENPTCDGRAAALTTVQEDEIIESGVLVFALHEHPNHLTIPELSLILRRDSERKDAIERAIDELIGNGLFQVSGGLVVPTRPALYFQRLREHL